MVFLFSSRNSKTEKELIQILTACGADYINDKSVISTSGLFNVVSFYKPTNLQIKKGIAVMIDDTEKFIKQKLPYFMTGICEDKNFGGLHLFKNNSINVVTCGNGLKNTITISSINKNDYVISLQRKIIDVYGNKVYPTDYKIKLKRKYSNTAILLSVAILLLNGIEPKEI